MADVSITAANVLAASTASTKQGTGGEAFTQGDVLYKRSSDNKYLKAQADGTAEEAGSVELVMALTDCAADGQPCVVLTLGDVDLGSVLTEGEIYVVSATAGAIAPEADISTSTHYVTVVGVAVDSDTLEFRPIHSGAQIP